MTTTDRQSRKRPTTPECDSPSGETHLGPSTTTPIKPGRPSRSAEFYHGTLSMKQECFLKDVSAVSEVSIETFLSCALPQYCLEDAMEVQRQLSCINTAGQCTLFAENPKKEGKSEAEAFKPLEVLFKAVVTHVPPCPTPITSLVTGHTTPLGRTHNSTRPDGYLQLEVPTILRPPGWPQTREHLAWDDIIQVWELKLSDSLREQCDVNPFH
jgi:hypothetical protein